MNNLKQMSFADLSAMKGQIIQTLNTMRSNLQKLTLLNNSVSMEMQNRIDFAANQNRKIEKTAWQTVFENVVSCINERESQKDCKAALEMFFSATARESDPLDQHIDWVQVLLAEYQDLLSWAIEIGYKEEDVDSRMLCQSKVKSLVENIRAAIKFAHPFFGGITDQDIEDSDSGPLPAPPGISPKKCSSNF